MKAKTLLTLGATLLVALNSTALAGNGGRGNNGQSLILPAQGIYAGKTLSEWQRAAVEWATSIPGTLTDIPWNNDGSSFQLNQTGPVFFLGTSGNWSDQIPEGTPLIDALAYANPRQIHITVPAGKALYMDFDSALASLSNNALEEMSAQEWLINDVIPWVETWRPIDIVLEIDGQLVPFDDSANSAFYTSSIITPLRIPQNSSFIPWLGVDFLAEFGGYEIPTVLAYGVACLVKPLPVGEHTTRVRTFDAWYGYPLSEVHAADWHITVTPE